MKVLAATKALEVLETLSRQEGIELIQALYTGQICDALEGARLVIIDFEDVVPHPRSIEYVKGILASSDAHVYTSQAFLQQPEYLLERARQEAGEITRLPDKMVIAFVSYSGGTGKTTLAIDTAIHFARRTRRPVFLTEFVYGKSALAALTRLDMPHLFELATQVGVEAAKWEGVTVAPMDYDYGSLLPREIISNYLNRQLGSHVLSIIDARWPHALLDMVADAVDLWLIVTSPRADALENAEKLKKELEESLGQAAEGTASPFHPRTTGGARGGVRTAIVLNQKGGLVDSLALAGTHFDLELGRIAQPDGRWDGQLGRKVLGVVYKESWKQFERPNVLARITGRLGQALGGRRPLSPLRALGLWALFSLLAVAADLLTGGGLVWALWLAVGLLIIPAMAMVGVIQRRLPTGGPGLYRALAGWAILALMFLGMGWIGWYPSGAGWAIFPILGAAIWPLWALATGRARGRRRRLTVMGWVILALVFLVLDMVLDGWAGLQWAAIPILASAAWPLFEPRS